MGSGRIGLIFFKKGEIVCNWSGFLQEIKSTNLLIFFWASGQLVIWNVTKVELRYLPRRRPAVILRRNSSWATSISFHGPLQYYLFFDHLQGPNETRQHAVYTNSILAFKSVSQVNKCKRLTNWSVQPTTAPYFCKNMNESMAAGQISKHLWNVYSSLALLC